MPHDGPAAIAKGKRRNPRSGARGVRDGAHLRQPLRLIHRSDPNRKVTVPVHAKDLKRGTLRGIIAQAGLTMPEFIALL